MKKLYKKSLFIFHRDLRIYDNSGLSLALQESEWVIPCFIFDPKQVGNKNKYRSMNAIQFMISSLRELALDIKRKKGALYFFFGKPEIIIEKLIKEENIQSVYCNKDYTPFSLAREQKIQKICNKNNCHFSQSSDLLLQEPELIKNTNGEPYSIFTAFFKAALRYSVNKPQKITTFEFYMNSRLYAESSVIFQKVLRSYNNRFIQVKGGRREGIKLLKKVKELNDYAKTKDYPAHQTSHLSAHLKFGTVSIREAYWYIRDTLSNSQPLLRQLYWRDFFTYIAYHSPFVFGHPYHKKYEKLSWNKNTKDFKAWMDGKTGFPIVDAGMRQLKQTGYMHNRVRLIVGSFLTKDLHIDWRWGERYFATQLVDYDPCVNNGNWQWVASTGCDAQPYFRIFNPWLQQKKFDPQAEYIKRWIPELKKVDVKRIHGWHNLRNAAIKDYPRPIINHEKQSQISKKIYKLV